MSQSQSFLSTIPINCIRKLYEEEGQYQEQSHGKNYRRRMNQNFQYQQGRRGNRRGNHVNNQQREWPYQQMNRSPQEINHAMVAQQGENIPYCSCRDHHPRCYHGMQGPGKYRYEVEN